MSFNDVPWIPYQPIALLPLISHPLDRSVPVFVAVMFDPSVLAEGIVQNHLAASGSKLATAHLPKKECKSSYRNYWNLETTNKSGSSTS